MLFFRIKACLLTGLSLLPSMFISGTISSNLVSMRYTKMIISFKITVNVLK